MFRVDAWVNHNNGDPNFCVFVNFSTNYVIAKYPFHRRVTFICIWLTNFIIKVLKHLISANITPWFELKTSIHSKSNESS